MSLVWIKSFINDCQDAKDVDDCVEGVKEFFKGDEDKAFLWFTTENPHLGYIKPISMIKTGRQKKLLKFIKTQIDDNK